MKMEHASFTSISNGSQAAKEFGINFDATLAYSLMSGIAKDKVGYPVREVGTNAYDANPHVPFDVQLPNWLDPTFRIRDYGPGLSHDDIMSIYTTFGGSGKRHTNEQVGGLGYGSKSPFAYLISRTQGAASFVVISYHEGLMHTYVMALSASGMPTVQYMGATPSDAPSGIEVSFTVSKNDIDRFVQAARSIYWHFPIRPNGIEWDDTPALENGKNWTLYQATAPFSHPHVRMGCVAYPIDFQRLGHPDWPWRYNEIVFDAPIGSLSFTTSREDLGYDDATISQINSLLREFERDYAPKVQALLDPAKNYFEACHIYKDLLTTHPGTEHLNHVGLISFNGKPLREEFTGSRDEFTLMVSSHYDLIKYEAEGFHGYRDRTWSLETYNFKNVKSVIYSTTKDRLLARVKELSPPTPYLLIRGAVLIDDAMRSLGIDGEFEPVDLATVKLPRRPKGEPKPKVRKTHYFVSSHSPLSHECIDRTQGGIYLRHVASVTNGWRRKRTTYYFSAGGAQIEGYALQEEIKLLRNAGVLTEKVWVFRGDDEPETENWIEFGDFVAEKLGPKVDLSDLADKAGSGFDGNWEKWLLAVPKMDPTLVPQDIFDFVIELQAFKDLREKAVSESSLLNLYLKYRPAPDNQKQETRKERLKRLESDLYGKYPLLSKLAGSWNYYSGADRENIEQAHHYFYLLANQK